MSKVELESFLKAFFLFFSSLGILVSTLFYLSYQKEVLSLDEKLLSKMKICSYNLKCKQFDIDFIPLQSQELYKLYKTDKELTSYYPIPNSQKHIMVLKLKHLKYQKKLALLKESALWQFSITLAIVAILSMLFSIYALYPLRNALLLTQEFIKDILHDFNTPLASLRLNSSMLKKELGENSKIARIELSVQNILNLQTHLKSYLQNSALDKEQFDLEKLTQEIVFNIQKSYPDILFNINIPRQLLFTNKNALMRIIDNLLINAVKYNKKNGSVTVEYNNETLFISDTGKGIKNPKRIFERFYKEQERGIGIGLHIVSKLCEELEIKIGLKSELEVGSKFSLNISKLILR